MQAALPGALDWAGTGLRQLAHHTSFYTLANRAALGSAFITSPVHKRHSVTPDVQKRHSSGAVLGHWLTKIPLGTPFDNVLQPFV